jgi:hypothetical protein
MQYFLTGTATLRLARLSFSITQPDVQSSPKDSAAIILQQSEEPGPLAIDNLLVTHQEDLLPLRSNWKVCSKR